MEQLTAYTLKEILALIFSVLIGSGAYMGFVKLKKNQKLTVEYVVIVLMMNLFVTFVFSELLSLLKWGEYRAPALPIIAFSGQYILDWYGKRNSKIFDALAEKANINLKDEKEDEKDNNEV